MGHTSVRIPRWVALSTLLSWFVCLSVQGETRLFTGDELYRIIWTIDAESGIVLNAFAAPSAVDGGHSDVGPLPVTSGLAFDGVDLFYTRGTADSIWVLDPDTGAIRRTLQKPLRELTGLATDGESLFAVAPSPQGGPIYVLDLTTGALLRRLELPRARAGLTYAGPRGTLFVSIGALEIREVDPLTGETLQSFVPPGSLAGLSYSSSAGALFAVDASGTFYRINPDGGAVLAAYNAYDAYGDVLPAVSSLATDEVTPAPAGDAAVEEEGEGEGGGERPATLLYEAQDATGSVGETIEVPVLLTASEAAEAFVVALVHAPSVLRIDEITIEDTVTAENGADFFSEEVFSNGGTLGVVMDILAPFEDNKIPAGSDLVIARYKYICFLADLEEEIETEVRFVDGVLGDPVKYNVVVFSGQSHSPDTSPGRVFCEPRKPVEGGPEFYCGGPLGPDGLPTPLAAGSGEEVEVSLYYAFPDPKGGVVQGLSMALAYDCRLTCLDDTFNVPPESITAQVNADFVQFHCDNDPGDGDGCEMVFGVLVDSFPPFDGRALPPTEHPLLLAKVNMRIGPGVDAGECLEMRFRDGVNGSGNVPVRNLVAVENMSFPVELFPCDVCVTAVGPSFYAGGSTLDENDLPEVVVGEPGEVVEVCLWYRSPSDDILSLTQAIRFDCNLECLEGTFRIDEQIPELQEADLVELRCESDPDDGDGCEMVLTVVFSDPGISGGALLPATNRPRRLGCVDMRISDEAPPGRCNVLEYLDGINGTGDTPINNEVQFLNETVSPDTFDGLVCVEALLPRFFCGGSTLGDDGLPVPAGDGTRWKTTELCFWYSSPVDELTTRDEIQGLSMSIAVDCGLTCVEDSFYFPPGSITDEVQPEFVEFHCDNDPMDGDGCEIVLGIVVEAFPPFTGRTLPPSDTPLLIGCVDMEIDKRAAADLCLPVVFRDKLDGTGNVPVKNLVAVNNESVSPEKHDCELCIDVLGVEFFCGGTELGPDGLPAPAEGIAGSRAELCFWYRSPEDHAVGHEQRDHLQGLTMALAYDCRLTCIEESFRIPEDSVAHAIGVEFVTFDCDSDPNDGDGCQLVLGILVDTEPPFDGRTLPPTEVPLKLACVDMLIPGESECDDCLPVTFENKIDGSGNVPVSNLVAADDYSYWAITQNCLVCTAAEPIHFIRGDCNFDGELDVSDAAMIISTLFGEGTWKPLPRCLDACDTNDDGRLDLADAHSVLIYVFTLRKWLPPDPGPIEPGPDPTDDKLSCELEPCP